MPDTVNYPSAECDCGETYEGLDATASAWTCRKCLRYLSEADYAARTVRIVIDGEAVWSVRPGSPITITEGGETRTEGTWVVLP